MSFQQGLSGLNAAARNLDVIGNNVANSNTVGFKGSRAVFSDVYAASLSGSGGTGIGIGTSVAQIQQLFTQGNVTVTNNPLDLAINGGGLFRMASPSGVTYSRNGQFHLDNQGVIVNSESLALTGYPVDAQGNVVTSAPQPLQITRGDISPKETSQFNAVVNLDSRAPALAAAFNAADPSTYTSSTSGTVYDSLGNQHVLSLYFTRTPVAGQWNVQAVVDGGLPADVDFGAGAGNPLTLNFDTSGVLTTPSPAATALMTVSSGAVTPISVDLGFAGSTQFGAGFGVNALTQDGYTSGRMTGFNISSDGRVLGQYSNGQAKTMGQVVLGNFSNPQGLQPLGKNQFAETGDSGQAVISTPGSGSMGVLQSAAVEDSNVDLTQELVNMITAQRVYQANAQTIKTQDQVLQTLVNLR